MYHRQSPTCAALITSITVLLVTPFCSLHAAPQPACKRHLTPDIVTLSDCYSVADNLAFITAHAQELTLPITGLELKPLSQKQGLRGRYSQYQQLINGYLVHNGIISVLQDNTGRVQRVYSPNTTTPQIAARKSSAHTFTASIDQTQAEHRALQALEKDAVGIPQVKISQHAEKAWYTSPDGLMRLAWKIQATGENPLGDFTVFIAADDGQLLLKQNRIAFFHRGLGRIFTPNPVQSSGITSLTDQNDAASSLPTSQLVNVTLQGLSDNPEGLLKGQFVDVASLNTTKFPQTTYPDARQPNSHYLYNRDDPRFEQVMAYHTIDTYQRYLQSLGFNDKNPTPTGIHQFPIRANVHWYNTDSSFYRPDDDTLHFGDGGVDDAEDADIILHEYGHAIQQAQNPHWECRDSNDENCEMRAMGEGFADYIAADFHAHEGNPAYQSKQAACIGEWDATAYNTEKTVPACLRRVDGQKIYPKDKVGETYADATIWSRALWDIRAALGSTIANQIILEHHYALPVGATMPMAALEMLSVDADLFASLHETALRHAFCTRGILNTSECTPAKNSKRIIYTSKDSFISQSADNRNYGNHNYLKIGGRPNQESRTVLGFNVAAIDRKKIKSAVLELSIADSNKHWGTVGRTVDIHPLRADFSEGKGNDFNLAVWPWTLLSHTPGVTWRCAADKDIGNDWPNCTLSWSGGVGHHKNFLSGHSAPVVHNNDTVDKVHWAVTDDLKAGINRWLIKTTFPENGTVAYYSKEGAANAHNKTLSPQLIITFYP